MPASCIGMRTTDGGWCTTAMSCSDPFGNARARSPRKTAALIDDGITILEIADFRLQMSD
jgi:hypothetical protein